MKRHSRAKGSTLLVTLAIVVLLTMIAGTAARIVIANRCILTQNASWQEALIVAESGIHRGIAQVNDQLRPQLNQTFPPNLSGSQSFTVTHNHGGEGMTTSSARYVITGTYCQVGTSVTTLRPYFRIVSTGSCLLSGNRFVTMASADAALRKLTLSGTAPRAVRQIEVWLRPGYSTDVAICTDGTIRLNNHNISVDSFNSQSYSDANLGNRRCDPIRDANGNIVSYGPNPIIGFYNSVELNHEKGGVMSADHMLASLGTNQAIALLGNSRIYGDVMTNGGASIDGSTVTGTANVKGVVTDDYYQKLTPVTSPTGTFQSITIPNKGITLTGGTKTNPARYQVNGNVSVAGANAKLSFDYPLTSGTNKDLSQNYIELYITGNFSTKGGGNGDGSIVIENGIQVKIYVSGNIDLGGNGIANKNGNASSLSILGITPLDGSSRSADFGGNSTFYGTVYAPAFDLTLGGTPIYVGSLVGKSATLVGNVNIRYDEALAGAGSIIRFAPASWFENPMKQQ